MIKVFAALVCLFACLSSTTAGPFDHDFQLAASNAWVSFVQTYEKSYVSVEEQQQRKMQFFANYLDIVQHNKLYEKGEVTWEKGVNMFTDLSSDEFLSRYTGYKPQDIPQEESNDTNVRGAPTATNPTNLDYRNSSYILSPVRDQGDCGGCWAFGTIATVEGAYNKKMGKRAGSFSEQYLIDCDRAQNGGCGGGLEYYAIDYIIKNGAVNATNYPYTAKNGTCLSKTKTKLSFTRGYKLSPTDTDLKTYLNSFGVLSVGIDGTALQSYKSGIFSSSKCKSINHAVNLVGYQGTSYWILRNSWSSTWGEGGYFRLSMSNPCLMKYDVVYAIF